MFEDYKNQLTETYKERCSKSMLSNALINPTPAKLKRECVAVYARNSNTPNDYRTLSDFFGQPGDSGSFESLIKRFDVDKFRPLNNFLLGKTNDPDDRNIELLAWLMDFKPRPYRFDDFQKSNSTPAELPRTTESNSQITKEPTQLPDHPSEKKQRNLSILGKWFLPMAGVGVLIMVSSFLFFWGGSKPDQHCMYWANDHYESINCNKKIFGKESIALDTLLLLHFKKITRPDTITDKSLGRIWYVKTGGKLEFFTADGQHPIDKKKGLKPITSYVIHKYCDRK
ncbi:hypothetical protein ABIB40_000177 [Pedobacter sp. UYP30]|uniref:hypothetical protein n=1 Tax=Pedobacter sp. UYP30 TaxID=1756400 RepID=UPI003390F8EB